MISFNASIQIPAPPDQVFAAFSQPERLAKWWGPDGFTNTFSICNFKNGGQWSFTMHGPDGHNYPNESLFLEIVPAKTVIIQHISEPKFRLTVSLSPFENGTLVSWTQTFENAEVARRVEHIVVPANDQNLARLSAEVLRK